MLSKTPWTRLMQTTVQSCVFQLCAILLVGGGAVAQGNDKLDAAVAYLNGIGVPIPPGYTVSFGHVDPPALAESDPAAGTITVDPENIKAACPSLTEPVENLGGVLVGVLYHEIKHLDGSYGYSPCDDINNTFHVAGKVCEFVAFILATLPGADVCQLCAFYNDIRHSFNDGAIVPGGASTVHAQNNCGTPYPGDIPECEACGGC